MRLSEFEIESIKQMASRHFGTDVQVFLFGSRTMNQLRGGDIDLFIRNPNGEHLKTRTKINFITDLILLIGEQKIDVILGNQLTKNSVLFKTIYQTGIQLC
jgi:predicted nucleotidyltransferase